MHLGFKNHILINMGDWSSATYIASQVVTILAFVLLGATFFIKRRSAILFLVIGFSILMVIGCALLSAWVGVGMFSIAIVRNIVMWFTHRFKRVKNRITLIDWLVLGFFTIAMVLTTVFTATGAMTWFGFAASYAYTLAIWQKNVLVYRAVSFISDSCWIVYNAVIGSLMGVILESIITTVIIASLVLGLWQVGRHRKSHSDTLSLPTV